MQASAYPVRAATARGLPGPLASSWAWAFPKQTATS